jgi:nucleotide-binding universal stress UspA family protein
MATTTMKALLAVDGTPASSHAADFLVHFMKQGDRVVVYHAAKSDEEDYLTRGIALKCSKAVGEEGVFAVTEYSKNVVQGILTTAKREEVDLIVLGSHEKGAIKRAFLGSKSTDIMHLAHRPVLIVHQPPREERNSFLLCYDGTDSSKAALDFLAKFARNGDLVSIFCSFIPPPLTVAAGNVAMRNPTYFSDLKEMTDRATLLLRDAKHRFRAHAPQMAEADIHLHVAASEDPEREAVRYADQNNFKTLVCGTHGHGAAHRLLLGSFSDDLIHEAHNHAVLVVPTIQEELRTH